MRVVDMNVVKSIDKAVRLIFVASLLQEEKNEEMLYSIPEPGIRQRLVVRKRMVMEWGKHEESHCSKRFRPEHIQDKRTLGFEFFRTEDRKSFTPPKEVNYLLLQKYEVVPTLHTWILFC